MTVITTSGERFEVEDQVSYRQDVGIYKLTEADQYVSILDEDVLAIRFCDKEEMEMFYGTCSVPYDEWILE